MDKKILLATIQYLDEKQNPDQEDLKNEKRAWNRLVELGEKQEEDIPARLADVEVLSAAEEAAIIQAKEAAEKAEKERLATEEKVKLEGAQGNEKPEEPKPETTTPKKKTTTKKAAASK